MSARALQTTILIAVLGGACGTGLWWALRNPVADLARRSTAQPADTAPTETEDRRSRPEPPSTAYVGSNVCAECHPDVSERYEAHPMGRSMGHVRHVEPIEDYEAETRFNAPPSTHTDLTLSYYVERDGSDVFHHEQMLKPDGSVLYDQSVPIHYAVGSGQRGRSYMTNRDGILLMSPITWYSEKGRWDFSPGYQVNNMRFERRITDGCISCHAGRVASDRQQRHRFAEEPIVEASIGCERCHGPGQGHVAFQRGMASGGQADTIVNPADLEPGRRDAVCFQCHLQGVERIPRYGRRDFDFRPGDFVSDIWTIFVRGTGVAEDRTTEAVSQVEQMLSSECYRASGGRLGCISCHDPHSTPPPEQRLAFYRARCLACHMEREGEARAEAAQDDRRLVAGHCSLPVEQRVSATEGDSCIDCHMPPIEANDVPHTSQTDHRILRNPKHVDEADIENQSMFTVFRESEGRIPQAELDRARGLLYLIRAERQDDSVLAARAIPLLQNWLKKTPDDQSAIEALGAAYWINRDVTQALTIWEHGLSLNPNNEDILSRMMVACHELDRREEGIRLGRRLVALNPWYHDYFGRLAHMYGQLGRFEAGIQAARRAVELNPAAGGIHGWLSEAYSIVGDKSKAAKHRAMYEALRRRD